MINFLQITTPLSLCKLLPKKQRANAVPLPMRDGDRLASGMVLCTVFFHDSTKESVEIY